MLYLQYILKEAAHAHQRGHERLKLPHESVDKLQRLADKMWYTEGRSKLIHSGNSFYSPLRDHTNSVIGFATFKKVGNPGRNRLVLTTILNGHMKPNGTNIGNFFNSKVPGMYPTAHLPEKFQRFDPIPGTK